jgi:hypothetical protein
LAARPAAAGQAPVVSAQAAQDVRAVSDELARLKREFEAVRRQYDERLLALEQRLAQIGGPVAGAAPAAPEPQPAAPPSAAVQAPQPTTGAGSKAFNPDISVNGNFLGVAGKNEVNPQPPLQLSEVEASFQAVVDPYAKADFFVSFGAEGVEIEEGFITFTSLPANLLVKAGKLRAQFGKMNTLHTHALPSADRPLVTQNLVGGDEGLSDAGFSVSHLVNNPVLFLEFTGEVYQGSSDVFQSDSRSQLAYVGRARAYRDLTESTNLDVGASAAFGTAAVGFEGDSLISYGNKQLFGVDMTFRYRPLRRAIYQRLNLRTELVWSRQDVPAAPQVRAFGYYALGEYQFARRWYLGGRLDRSGRTLEVDAIDRGGSVFLTFWPTEFSQVRSQYRYISFAEGVRSHEFLFQLNFTIGAHGAHIF